MTFLPPDDKINAEKREKSETIMDRKYVAFISYRHAELDSAVAKQMHTLIERYVVPKKLRKNGQKKLGIVFRDQ